MMEYWNVGLVVLAQWDLFLVRKVRVKSKIRPSSAADFQNSTSPSFQYSVGVKAYPCGLDKGRTFLARILY